MNITLHFLPGHYYLDQELSLVSVHNFAMTKDVQYGNDTVFVDCYEQGMCHFYDKICLHSKSAIQYYIWTKVVYSSVDQFILITESAIGNT